MALTALAPAAFGIIIEPTRFDDRPPTSQELQAWAEAAKAADTAEARILREIVARSAVERCAPDNWIDVEERGVICRHPNTKALAFPKESAFIENVLIPAAALAEHGYAVVPPARDEKGDGFLIAKVGRAQISRKTVYVIVEKELSRRKRARAAAALMDSAAANLR